MARYSTLRRTHILRRECHRVRPGEGIADAYQRSQLRGRSAVVGSLSVWQSELSLILRLQQRCFERQLHSLYERLIESYTTVGVEFTSERCERGVRCDTVDGAIWLATLFVEIDVDKNPICVRYTPTSPYVVRILLSVGGSKRMSAYEIFRKGENWMPFGSGMGCEKEAYIRLIQSILTEAKRLRERRGPALCLVHS